MNNECVICKRVRIVSLFEWILRKLQYLWCVCAHSHENAKYVDSVMSLQATNEQIKKNKSFLYTGEYVSVMSTERNLNCKICWILHGILLMNKLL